MNKTIRFLALLLLATPLAQSAEPVAKQFLSYVYGAEVDNLAAICHPSDDLWMVPGPKNENALAALAAEKFKSPKSGVCSGVLGTDIYFIEIRDGLVDPAFSLDGVYSLHRQLVLQFIYSSLSRDQSALKRLTTDASKVKIDGKKAADGDMDQYGSIIQVMPVVRSSRSSEDAKTKTVTYRVPVGDTTLALTLVKEQGIWKIDTSKSVRVPLEFFFRSDE